MIRAIEGRVETEGAHDQVLELLVVDGHELQLVDPDERRGLHDEFLELLIERGALLRIELDGGLVHELIRPRRGPAGLVGSIVFAIAAVNWPTVARLVRGEFLAMRGREFVQACICLGMTDGRVIFRHILPNCLSPIIVTGSLTVATAILIESALSFMGLGDPNVMSRGFMIGAGRTFLRSAWWLCTIPGVAILLTVLAINLVGEGLNDALSPRLRR
jgi:ABC-type dipeptide/oligopeptide/nickel transport system permease subunit